MRISVMGRGGGGVGYFGARLARADCEPGLTARGRKLKALHTRGLRVESPPGCWSGRGWTSPRLSKNGQHSSAVSLSLSSAIVWACTTR